MQEHTNQLRVITLRDSSEVPPFGRRNNDVRREKRRKNRMEEERRRERQR